MGHCSPPCLDGRRRVPATHPRPRSSPRPPYTLPLLELNFPLLHQMVEVSTESQRPSFWTNGAISTGGGGGREPQPPIHAGLSKFFAAPTFDHNASVRYWENADTHLFLEVVSPEWHFVNPPTAFNIDRLRSSLRPLWLCNEGGSVLVDPVGFRRFPLSHPRVYQPQAFLRPPPNPPVPRPPVRNGLGHLPRKTDEST